VAVAFTAAELYQAFEVTIDSLEALDGVVASLEAEQLRVKDKSLRTAGSPTPITAPGVERRDSASVSGNELLAAAGQNGRGEAHQCGREQAQPV
jgi:hypothetical protein